MSAWVGAIGAATAFKSKQKPPSSRIARLGSERGPGAREDLGRAVRKHTEHRLRGARGQRESGKELG